MVLLSISEPYYLGRHRRLLIRDLLFADLPQSCNIMKSGEQHVEAKGYDYDYANAEATRTHSIEGEIDVALPGAVGETHRGLKSRHIQFL